MAERMEIPINDVVRGLIPRFSHPRAPEVAPMKTPEKTLTDTGPYKIIENFDDARLSEILKELIKERKAVTLAEEIKAQLIDDNYGRENLNITTEKRLLRWAHPARVDDRTRFVKPRAREICIILFGFIPDRED
jgi:hypothetical protein